MAGGQFPGAGLEREAGIALDRRGLDHLNLDQLRSAVKADRVIPDSINVAGRNVDIIDVFKDRRAADAFSNRLEQRHMAGEGDFSRQIALVQELAERQTGRRRTTMPSDRLESGCQIQTNVDPRSDFARACNGFAADEKALHRALGMDKEDIGVDRGTMNAVENQQVKQMDYDRVRTPTSLLGGARG